MSTSADFIKDFFLIFIIIAVINLIIGVISTSLLVTYKVVKRSQVTWPLIFLFAIFLALMMTFGLYIHAISSPLGVPAVSACANLRGNDYNHVVDVRTEMEYNSAHLEGSINIPLSTLTDNLSSVLPNKAESILFVCRSGNRARQAAEIALSKGYKNVHYLIGSALDLENCLQLRIKAA